MQKAVTRKIMAVFAAGLGTVLAGTVYAAELMAAGGLYAGQSQAVALCSIFNGGSAAITLSGFKILGSNGATALQLGTTCSSTLTAGSTCRIWTGITATDTYACRVMVGPSKAAVRGTFELRNSNQNVLGRIELR